MSEDGDAAAAAAEIIDGDGNGDDLDEDGSNFEDAIADGAVIYNTEISKFACLFCLGMLRVPVISLPCGHSFCMDCIQGYVNENIESGRTNTCPYSNCGRKFQSVAKFLRPNYLLSLLLPHQTLLMQSFDPSVLVSGLRDLTVKASHLRDAEMHMRELMENYNDAVKFYNLHREMEGIKRLQLFQKTDVTGFAGAADVCLVRRAQRVFRGLPNKVFRSIIFDQSWQKVALIPEAMDKIRELPFLGLLSPDSVIVIPARAAHIGTAIELMHELHFTYKHILLEEVQVPASQKSQTKKAKTRDVNVITYYLIGVMQTRLMDETNKQGKVMSILTEKLNHPAAATMEELMKMLKRFVPRLLLFTDRPCAGTDLWGPDFIAKITPQPVQKRKKNQKQNNKDNAIDLDDDDDEDEDDEDEREDDDDEEED